MKFAAAVSLLVLTAVASHAQHPVRFEQNQSLPALFPLFISADLRSQFATPSIDERELFWLTTPVSREGARMLEAAGNQRRVTQVPLVLVNVNRVIDAAAPFEPSTWVRIRALYGR